MRAGRPIARRNACEIQVGRRTGTRRRQYATLPAFGALAAELATRVEFLLADIFDAATAA